MRLSLSVLLLPIVVGAQSPQSSVAPESLFASGRFNEARAAFESQLARNKNDANALYYMGRIADAQDKPKEAVDWFEKAVKQNAQSALYHTWLGNALGDVAQNANKLKQPFLARRVKSEFEKAVQLDPTMWEPRSGLVDFYSVAPGIMGGDMAKAKEQAAALVKLHPLRGHLAEARIADRVKDSTSALAAYKAAVDVAPDSAQGYYALAGWFRRQSRWDEAFATYDALMQRKADEVPAHASWGIVAAISGKNLERGERELKYWLANAPQNANALSYSNVHMRLGQIYERTARLDSARAQYREAVARNPENKTAKEMLAALK
jgi:tetratricopeptide (TPR) repeat protein